ncbi:MAG: amidohydrolase family protein [Phycisphaerales bacterium]|nr:amidohydrolase family protein [Planctomycetota bacterium]MCH8508160.1 amidohydrolase family protein [Phycisphaerales bacterium]
MHTHTPARFTHRFTHRYPRRFITTLLALIVLSPAAFAARPVGSEPPPVLLRGVSVIDVDQGSASGPQDVLIRAGLIERIADPGSIDPPTDARQVDAAGRYLIPGLFDAHVHILAGQGVFEPLLIAHGVTAARDTGAPTEAILEARRQSASHDFVGPDLIVTGAIIDGRPPVWPMSEECETAEEARDAVRRLAAAGVDQIKVYSRLPREAYFAALAEARALGLPVTGHVPESVTLEEAIEAGQDCIEHFEGFAPLLRRLNPPERAPDRTGVFAGFDGWLRYGSVDRERLDAVLDQLAEHAVMQCPTLAVWHGLASDPSIREDARMAYIPGMLGGMWAGALNEEFAGFVRLAMRSMRSLVADLHAAGVPMMIGTDLGNPFVFPGWSVHEEMRRFRDAGVPDAEVLRMATIVPARFCGVHDRLGTVEEGKQASLVLLNANPLEDIGAVSEIEAVFLRGRLFDRADLDALLAQAAEDARGQTPVAAKIELRLPGEVLHRGTLTQTFQQWDAGAEHFLVTRSDDGLRLLVHNAPTGGGLQPTLSMLHHDPDGRLVRAEWTQLTETPVRAVYTIENNRLTATARRGDDEPETVTIDLPDGAIVTPSVFAADMLILPTLALAPGESREVELVSFGFPSWQPQRARTTIERHDPEPITLGQGDHARTVEAIPYTTRTRSPAGETVSRVWLGPDGLLLRSQLDLGYGTLRAEIAAE